MLGNKIHRDHQGQPHEGPRQHTGQEEPGHGDFGQVAIDDKRDAGGDNRPDRRGGGRNRGREFPVIAVIPHGFHLDHAEPGGVGHGRPRHAGENHAGDHVDLTQSPPDMAHQGPREPEDPLGDPAVVHQIPGQDKERDGQERKGSGRGVHALGHHGENIGLSHNDKRQSGRQTHADGDGHAQKNQPDHDREDNKGPHRLKALSRFRFIG